MTDVRSNRIHRLEPAVANQIAAGEVVERPANACKELIENALDAGARRIVIDIEEGGKKLIRVRDDGIGMSAADAVLALQRHATSKLRTADDLAAVRTLGFRGEALPSIAAVSNLELTTREASAEAGTRLTVEAGVVTEATEVGASLGTEIAVRNLFYNTPARYKFLKSDAAEAARIAEVAGHLALANPHVGFQLRHNGNEVLRTDVGGNAFNTAVSVLGRDAARQLLPIAPPSENSAEIRVTGFAGRPQLTRANRNGQIFFVNGRVVRDRILQHALVAAYEGLLHGHGRYPVAIVFVEISPASVDVNVHPTKNEVRFAREWEVHHAVRIAVRETLIASQLAPDWGLGGQAATPQPVAAPENAGPFASSTPMPNGSRNWPPAYQSAPADYQGLHRPVAPSGGDISNFRTAYQSYTPPPLSPQTQAALPDIAPPPDEPRLSLRPLAQISHNAYILCEADDGLYIVCQHRAHERILADKAIAAAEGRPVESQHLVIPFTAEVGPRAAAAIEENLALLKDLGFEIESFGGASVLVRSVPALIAGGNYETVFGDLIEELLSGHGARTIQEKRRQLLTMLACKNAIKAGDPLNPPQMQGLIDDLLQLGNPSICPHGQPILIRISTLELDKKFEREYASR